MCKLGSLHTMSHIMFKGKVPLQGDPLVSVQTQLFSINCLHNVTSWLSLSGLVEADPSAGLPEICHNLYCGLWVIIIADIEHYRYWLFCFANMLRSCVVMKTPLLICICTYTYNRPFQISAQLMQCGVLASNATMARWDQFPQTSNQWRPNSCKGFNIQRWLIHCFTE